MRVSSQNGVTQKEKRRQIYPWWLKTLKLSCFSLRVDFLGFFLLVTEFFIRCFFGLLFCVCVCVCMHASALNARGMWDLIEALAAFKRLAPRQASFVWKCFRDNDLDSHVFLNVFISIINKHYTGMGYRI